MKQAGNQRKWRNSGKTVWTEEVLHIRSLIKTFYVMT